MTMRSEKIHNLAEGVLVLLILGAVLVGGAIIQETRTAAPRFWR